MRWTHDRVVACDGGGGAAGHPRIFINTDKPEIATCGYCGLPFVGFSLLPLSDFGVLGVSLVLGVEGGGELGSPGMLTRAAF